MEIVEIGHRYATPRASQLDDAQRWSVVFPDAVTTIRTPPLVGARYRRYIKTVGSPNVIERAEGFRDTRVVAQNAGRYRSRICRSSPPPMTSRDTQRAQTTETWPRSFAAAGYRLVR